MKFKLFSLLFSSLFLLGTTSFAHASLSDFDGGIILDIHDSKAGTLVCTFSIPDQYLNQDGNLILPLEVTLIQNGKVPVFSLQSTNAQIILPAYLSGSFLMSIQIGDLHFKQYISL